MPTLKPRHTITETEAIAQALDAAALLWPQDRNNRGKLAVRLIETGFKTVTLQQEKKIAERRAAVLATAGVLTGSYGPNYLANLREDWPQ